MSLNVTRFTLAEYKRSIWCATVEHGFQPVKLLEPPFWANVANILKPGDRIEVESESREWFVELYVLEVGAGFARVAMMRMDALNALDQSAVPTDLDFTVEFKGPVKKWSVIRKLDKAPIYEGLSSKDAALAKLAAHTRVPVAA